MIDALMLLIALAAAGVAAWTYRQVQQRERRMHAREDKLRAQSILVGELADELSMASHYLYETMDQCLARIEAFERRLEQEASALAPEQTPAAAVSEQPADATASVDDETEDGAEPVASTETEATATALTDGTGDAPEPDYHPHFHALELAAQGKDLVEIARHTGLGVEELRLLLRFQQELFVDG